MAKSCGLYAISSASYGFVINPSSTRVAGIAVLRRTYSVGLALTPRFCSPVELFFVQLHKYISVSACAVVPSEYTKKMPLYPLDDVISEAFACRLMK